MTYNAEDGSWGFNSSKEAEIRKKIIETQHLENSNFSIKFNEQIIIDNNKNNSPGFSEEASLITNGNIKARGRVLVSGSDYAEYFEWADSNPNGEDRTGYFVALDEAGKIKIANATDNIIGIVSAIPGIIGNSSDIEWSGKYLRDDFGRYLLDQNGALQLNPEYDSALKYVPRSQR